MSRPRSKKVRVTKFHRGVMINHVWTEVWFNALLNYWTDRDGKAYEQGTDGKFGPLRRSDPRLVSVPNGVKVEYLGTFSSNGIIYQFQPSGPEGKLIPVPVGKNPEVNSLSPSGSRVHAPAQPVRPK